MSFRRLRLLILFFAAAWLPFSAVAAVAMPFCQHGQPSGSAPAAAAHSEGGEAPWAHGDCHGHGEAGPAGAPAAQDGLACDQCGFCHLACAGILPPSAAATPVHRAAHVLAGIAVAHHSDPLPESLRRPPRSA